MKTLQGVAALAVAVLLAQSAPAQVITYDEAVDGMLSTDNLNPTVIGSLGLGINTVSGQVANARSGSATQDICGARHKDR